MAKFSIEFTCEPKNEETAQDVLDHMENELMDEGAMDVRGKIIDG